MNNHLVSSDYALWIASLLLPIAVLAAGFYRRQIRLFPAFFCYIAYSGAETLLLMYLVKHASYATYYYTYWIGAALRTLILLAVCYEVFFQIFAPLRTLPKRTEPTMAWIITLAITVIAAIGYLLPVHRATPLETFIRTMDRTATFIVFATFVTILAFSEMKGIPKRKNVFGISLGFTIMLSVDSVATAAVELYTTHQSPYFRGIQMGVFVLAQIVWLSYFARENPQVVPVTLEQAREAKDLIRSTDSNEKAESVIQ